MKESSKQSRGVEIGNWRPETGDRRGGDNQIKGKQNKEKK